MLKSLLIQNYAIIDEILLEFSRGLNILTGETGAGKSIIVDALTMLLGGKVTTDVIRSGQKKAIIEGTFELSENHPVISILTENDFSTDYSPLIIRREILDKGISRNIINDSPVQAGFLKKCGELLIDFHGQHDHQSLLKADSHIEILDSFGTYKNLKIKYSENYNKLKELIHQKSELIKKRNELYFTQEQQSIKLKEIERVDPKPDEDKIIESELKVIENAEILFNLTYVVNNILDEGDSAVRDKINKAAEFIEKLKNIDKQFEPYYNDLKSASVIIDEVSSFVNNYKHHIERESGNIAYAFATN